MTSTLLGGTFALAPDITVPRIGYGAMQLPGPQVFGPPKDHDAAVQVLRTAYESGIRHIDTADFYGPDVSNELIREALAPYPDDLHIVTKVGSVRDDQANWNAALAPDQLRDQVQRNLRTLGLEALDVVNLRIGGGDDAHTPVPGSLAEPFGALAAMRDEGLIRHLGVSTATAEQVAEAQTIAPVVCLQNYYNLANRQDDDLIDSLAAQGIAYVPYFPLGGFSPLQSDQLNTVAERLNSTPSAVAIAWLLQRSPNILLIPGTSSVEHLRANIEAAGLSLSDQDLAELDSIGR